jgi:hypothetical protein
MLLRLTPIDSTLLLPQCRYRTLNLKGITMGSSTSIDVSYRCEQGWHIFEAAQMPGLYIANHDAQRAFSAVAPAIEQLLQLDTGMQVQAAPEVSFADFIGGAASSVTGSHQRFNLFQTAP